MTGIMFTRLEAKYGIKIRHDFVGIRKGKVINYYKIFTADGCSWENGLTYKGILMECKRWAKELLIIKASNDKRIMIG